MNASIDASGEQKHSPIGLQNELDRVLKTTLDVCAARSGNSRYENQKETYLCSTDSKLDGLMSSPMGISSMIELKFAKSSPSL